MPEISDRSTCHKALAKNVGFSARHMLGMLDTVLGKHPNIVKAATNVAGGDVEVAGKSGRGGEAPCMTLISETSQLPAEGSFWTDLEVQ